MENNTENFMPRQIGETDTQKYNAIILRYTQLCETLTDLYYRLRGLLPGANLKTLFDYAQDKQPERFLVRRYALSRQSEFPGQDVEEMIRIGILIKPPEFAECLRLHSVLQLDLHGIREFKFFYILADLLKKDKKRIEEQVFVLDEFFFVDLEDFCTTYTQNEEQNEILEAIVKMQDCLLTFAKHKFFNPQTCNRKEFAGKFSFFFDVGKNTDNPIRISRNAFKNYALPGKLKYDHKEAMPNYSEKYLFDLD